MPAPENVIGGLPPVSCLSLARCGPPDRIPPEPPGMVRPPERALSKETVLRICMALDDSSLAWVIEALSADRTPLMEQAVKAWTARRPELWSCEARPEGITANGFVDVAAEALNSTSLTQEKVPALMYEAADAGGGSCVFRAPIDDADDTESKQDGGDLPERNMSFASSIDPGEINYLHELFLARDQKTHGPPPQYLVPRVQFWATMCYCSEAEPTVDIAFVRIGDVSRQSSACYETRDISAKAGKKYVACKGKVSFEIGERMKHVTLKTLNDDSWDATLEFAIVLLHDGLNNAVLEDALASCRIKIIDDDCFPTNKFQKQIIEGQLHKVSTPLLLLEYFKMNFQNPVVRKGLIKTALADQVENLYFILCLFLDLWMVDYVLCTDCVENADAARRNLYIIVALRVIPFGLVHYLQFRAVHWKVGGTSRLTLQANLLRKYMNYDEESLAQVDESKLIMAMTRDAFDLVHNAFCTIPKLIAALSRLVMLLIYQYATPVALGQELGGPIEMVTRFAPALIFPVAMLSFLYFRNPRTLAALEKQKKLQNEMLFHTRRTIGSFDLIRDYRKRGAYVDLFEAKIKTFNSSYTAASGIVCNNKKFAKWCSLLVVAAFTQIGGMSVASGDSEVGSFLNNLAIYAALGEMWGQAYDVLLDMQMVFDSLTTMVEYMNLPTDLLHRKRHYDRNKELMLSEFEDVLKESKWALCDPADKTYIELRDLSFRYMSKGLITGELKTSSAKLVQGGLYALVGPPSQGKGTILKLLGEVLIPFYPGFEKRAGGGGGDLVMPGHLGILHVSKDPTFVEGSLFYNLTFGCRDAAEFNMDRVVAICRKLGISENLIGTIKDADMRGCDWTKLLSSTDIALLHIARALITNPEVLCIHKPALFLNTEMSDNMYAVLKEFVTNRGLEEDPAEFYTRRPRTCIISARRVAGPAAECADAVFHVTAAEGLVLVKHHKASELSRPSRIS